MGFSDHVKVKFGADTKGFQEELGNAERMTKSFGNKFGKFFIGALGTAAIVKTTKDVIDFGAAIGDMALRLGTSTDFLQGLQYGAEQTGMKAQSATIAFQRFTRRTQEAREKAGPLRKTLEDLGIAFNHTNGVAKSTEELFKEFGERLSEMDNPAAKVKAAFQLLDTEGVALTQMFQKGAKSIDEYIDEATRLGMVMSGETIQGLRDVDGQMNALGRQFKVVWAEMLPPFLKVFEKLSKHLMSGMSVIKKYTEEILLLVGALATYKIASKAAAGVTVLATALKTLTGIAGGATVAFKTLDKAMKFSTVGIAVTGVLAVATALKKVHDKINEGEKLWRNWTEETLKKARQKGEQLATTVKALAEELRTLQSEINVGAGKGPELSLVQQLENARQLRAEQKATNKEVKRRVDLFDGLLVNYNATIKRMKEEGTNVALIAKQENYRLEIQQNLLQAKKDQLQADEQTAKINNDVKRLTKEVTDLEYLRSQNLEKILFVQTDEQLALDRKLERVKALKEGGEEQLEIVKKEHEMQDMIRALIKDKGLSAEDALQLAKDTTTATEKEKQLLEKVKTDAEAIKKARSDSASSQEKTKNELAETLRLQALAKEEAEEQLRILDLLAQGKNREAETLQARLTREREITALMANQGLTMDQAIAQLVRKEQLEGQIKDRKVEAEIAEIKKLAVEEMASKKRSEIIDKEDLKRRTAARNIISIEEEIARLIRNGAREGDQRLETLEQAKQAKFQILLTDDSKKAIADLQKQKAEINTGQEIQLTAIKEAQASLQSEINEAIAENAKQKAELIAEGQKINNANAEIAKTNVTALQEVTDKAVQKLDQIAKTPIEIKAPDVSPSIKVVVENELKEETQLQILEALEGKFVNQ